MYNHSGLCDNFVKMQKFNIGSLLHDLYKVMLMLSSIDILATLKPYGYLSQLLATAYCLACMGVLTSYCPC